MITIENNLKELPIDYELKINKLKEKRFVDFTHDGTGKMCTVYYNLRTKKYEFEPIQKNAR